MLDLELLVPAVVALESTVAVGSSSCFIEVALFSSSSFVISLLSFGASPPPPPPPFKPLSEGLGSDVEGFSEVCRAVIVEVGAADIAIEVWLFCETILICFLSGFSESESE